MFGEKNIGPKNFLGSKIVYGEKISDEYHLDKFYQQKTCEDKSYQDKCPKHPGSPCFSEIILHANFKLPSLSFFTCYIKGRKKWAAGGRQVVGGWVVSWQKIMPRCCSILQAGACQIFSLETDSKKKTTKFWTYVQIVGRQGISEPYFF